MRKSHIVVSILALLGLAAAIGWQVFASCLLAIGIVASYGVSMQILLNRRVGAQVLVTVASTTLALVAIVAGVGLISLWGIVLQYPFLSSLALWSAIFAGCASWALVATWLEEQGRSARVLRAVCG